MSSRTAATARTTDPVTFRGHATVFRVIEGGKGDVRPTRGAQQSPTVHARLFVIALVMLLALGAYWRHVDVISHQRLQRQLSQVSTEVIPVMPGDSLWDIAAAHPVRGCTTSQVAHHIVTSNGLDTSLLTVGMQVAREPCDVVGCEVELDEAEVEEGLAVCFE